MHPLIRNLMIFAIAVPCGMFATRGVLRVLRSPTRDLPYHDDFTNGDATGWVAYGGNWTVQSGAMVNESNERGARLVTGSRYWRNYAVDSDVSMSNTGEAGIIARVSGAETGVDSYRGVVASIRVRDESLVVGVADHAWDELATAPMPDPIVPNVWYHIHLELRGCDLKASAWRNGEGGIVRLDLKLAPCPAQGQFGLRSYDSGGQWKNVLVTELKDQPRE